MEKKRKVTSSPSLPDEILEDILSRIPAEHLLRLKRVCKSWRSLIQEALYPLPFLFIYPYTRLTYPAIASFRNHKRGEGKLARRFIGLEPNLVNFLPKDPHNIYAGRLNDIISCCNGLLLCRHRNSYCVCNPATRTWVLLPDPPEGYYIWLSALLAFDPDHSHHYKVVLIDRQCASTTNMLTFLIYSSTENKWGTPKPFPTGTCDFSHRRLMNLSLNGALYVYNQSGIIQIDTPTEKCRVISFPNGSAEDKLDGFFFMGLLGGHVCYAELEHLELNVWMLEGEDRWVMKHKNTKAMATKLICDRDVYHIKAFHPRLDIILVSRGRTTLSFYDIRRSRLEHVCQLRMIFEEPTHPFQRLDIQPFWPSFLEDRGDDLCAG